MDVVQRLLRLGWVSEAEKEGIWCRGGWKTRVNRHSRPVSGWAYALHQSTRLHVFFVGDGKSR